MLGNSWSVVKLKVQTCDPETLLLDWKIQPVNMTKLKREREPAAEKSEDKNIKIRKTCCSHFSLFNEIKFATDTKIHSSSEPKVRLFPHIK